MPDVFISYSRKNLEFVQQLVTALNNNGKDTWFDQLKEPLSGIAAGVPWWKQIQDGIENVDNFLFVITPDSMSSPYCHAEINYARDHGKRLVPVLYCGWIGEAETRKAIDAAIEAIPENEAIPNTVMSGILNLKKLVRANWLAISEIQYVIFASSIAFEQALGQLTQALDLDLAWVRMHSQLVQAAKLWEANDFDTDFLWGANRLKPVYEMIERRKPELDVLVLDFIKLEQERLLDELEQPETPHLRRSAIGERLSTIGDPREHIGVREGLPSIEWCEVSDGEVNIENQLLPVSPFYIAKYLITYSQFEAFAGDVEAYNDDLWWYGMPDAYCKEPMDEQRNKYDNYPRDTVSWYQAVAFTRWLDAQYRKKGLLPNPLRSMAEQTEMMPGNKKDADRSAWCIRLPTEWEWQWAAQAGDERRLFPWSRDLTDNICCNVSEAGIGRATAVGMYPDAAAVCGALDMAGNLWEWCLNDKENLTQISLENGQHKAMRGGSFYNDQIYASTTDRNDSSPDFGMFFDGFRIVFGPSI